VRYLLLILLLAGCQVAPKFADPIEGTVLANKPGFECELPHGWVKDDLDPNRPDGSSWRDTGDTAKVRISFEPMPAAALETVARGTIQALEGSTRVKDFQLVSQGPLELGGLPAHELVYFATINQRKRWHREVMAQHKDRLVIVSMLANPGQEDAHKQDFDKVLKTWRWSDSREGARNSP